MVIEEMTDRECRAMLDGTHVARLACALNNQPYIVPIHVDFYDAFLYGFATLGQKIEWMRQNPLVCLEIDEVKTHTQWASVVVFGRYEELPDTPRYEYDRGVAEQLFRRHPVWWEPASVPIAGHQPCSRILFRILIVGMTGRRAGTDAPETARLEYAPDARRRSWLAHVLRRVLGSDLMSFSRPELRFNFSEQVPFQLPRPVTLIASRGEAVKELAGLASVNPAQGIVLSGHAWAASIDRRLKFGIPIRNRALLIVRYLA